VYLHHPDNQSVVPASIPRILKMSYPVPWSGRMDTRWNWEVSFKLRR
jgi:hypothetical protein